MTSRNIQIRPHFTRADGAPVEWVVTSGLTPYPDALATMARRVESILAGEGKEAIWLLEHPPLYSAGVSARQSDLISPDRFPVFEGGRGGKHTYHGPGQRVVYVMLDLRAREKDVRALVSCLERWVIDALETFGVSAGVRSGRVGVWVDDQGEDRKIAAIGLKLRRWVSFHGVSLNVSPDLSHFEGIIPCGLSNFGVTSLERLGLSVDMEAADEALLRTFEAIFGPLAPQRTLAFA
jgi:lipoyl(octanoyl) transferase